MNPRLDIACNDPDTGLFEGRAWMIQMGSAIELGANDFRGPQMRVHDDFISIAGKRWPVLASKDWFGNWCWNRYEITADTAVDFLVWAQRRGFWSIEQAEDRIFNLWSNGHLAEAAHRDFLLRYLAKPSTYR